MYKLIIISMIIAYASAGLVAPLAVAHAPIAVAHAPIAVAAPVAVKAHVATSYANTNLLSGHHVPVAVHAAPVVHAPVVHAAPVISHGYGYGLH